MTKELKTDFLYTRIANVLQQQILNGTLETGDKLPSLRTICKEYGVNQNTALNALYFLEGKMLIEARPRSGYYVRYSQSRAPEIPRPTSPAAIAKSADSHFLVSRVYENLDETGCLLLSLGGPANELLPTAKLNKGLIQATRTLKNNGVAYAKVEGNERLRRQIAKRAFSMECNLGHDDIIVTNGCVDALSYSMMTLTKKGDTIAMESPVSFGMLQLAQSLGLKVLELPTHPTTGVDLNALESAIKSGRVNILLLISNFSNPLGSCMPDEHKKAAVGLAEQYHVPIIENDLNGDIYFGAQRPKSCKTYDRSGIVLWCSSVSKTLAPGYRVGWVAPGKFKDKILRKKLYHSISSPALTQEVVAHFLESGRYDKHLRTLRQTLHGNLLKYTNIIANHFPEGTLASNPAGGAVIWVELPGRTDTSELYESAIRHKISFAPGRMFTLQHQYNNCMRLNYGLNWNDELKNGLIRLAQIIKD